MGIQGVSSEIIDRMRANQPIVKDAVTLLIVEQSSSDDDAVSDVNVESWYQKVISEYRKNPEHPHRVSVSTCTMFNRLRVGVKHGEIKDIVLSIDGEKYGCVLPNGKFVTNEIPKETKVFQESEDIMFKLL